MSLNIEQEKYLQEAFASAKMEGFRITPEIERNTRRLLEGEVSIDEFVQEMLKKHIGQSEAV